MQEQMTQDPIKRWKQRVADLRNQNSFWKKLKTNKLLLSGIFLILIFVFYFIFLITGLPPLSKLENIDPALVTRLYSEDGEIIHELGVFKRIYVPIEKIPQSTIQALLSTEDRRFYSHWGVDLRRVPKVILINLLSFRFSQGFSTITMQLARNLFSELGFEKTITRKLREILTAIQIERTYSKQEILEMYLNVSYYGHGIYGIQAASKKYFNKDVQDLTVEEGATLVPVLNLPAFYSPINHPDRALKRRNFVLKNMVATRHLTESTYDSLSHIPLDINQFEQDSKIAPYFTEYVRQTLNELQDSLGVNVYEDGLNVYTTLNYTIQSCMDSVVEMYLPELQERVRKKLQTWKEKNEIPDSLFLEKSKVQVAFIALDHKNGHILAMVGGSDFKEKKFNCATQAKRQPGSAFKTFLYTSALDNGYTVIDKYLNQPYVVTNPDGTRWDPENYDKKWGGLTTLREGFRNSTNMIAVRLIQKIGPSVVAEYAHRMGITTPLRHFPTLALGSSEVIPLEIVSAFGIYANEGIKVEPVTITRIEDRFGNVIYRSTTKQSEVLNKATSYLMTNLLETVLNSGTGGRARWMYHFNQTAAGKTGTTNDYTDAWFIGFTPTLTAGVWVGLEDPKYTLGYGESGAIAALPFWASFMKKVYEKLDLPDKPFIQPPEIIRLSICQDSDKLATNYCPNMVEEVFNIKYHPTEQCPLHGGPKHTSQKKQILF
jgi:penicillin-binding protein 1A